MKLHNDFTDIFFNKNLSIFLYLFYALSPGGPFAILPVLFIFFPTLHAQTAVFLCFAAGVTISTASTMVSIIQSEIDVISIFLYILFHSPSFITR